MSVKSSPEPGRSRFVEPERVAARADRAPARGRELTRQRILASATSLFAARGLHDVTSHEIASEAGVAAGTFYNHFKHKQALFREIVFATIEQLKRDLISAGEGVSDREQKVRRRAEALVDFTERKTDLVRILFGRDREAAALGADVLDDLTAWLETEIRGPGPDLVHPGALVHPGIAAQAIVGMWARTLAWWAEAPGRAERQQLVDTIVELQLSGVSGTQT